MKKLFVPFTLATLAIKKGFKREDCLMIKIKDESVYPISKSENFNYDEFIEAPMHQQIVDWFRENHQIDIAYKLTSSNHRFQWNKDGSQPIEFPKGDAGGYYSAFNKALEEAFKLI